MTYEKHICLDMTADEIKAFASVPRSGGFIGVLQNLIYGPEEEEFKESEEETEDTEEDN